MKALRNRPAQEAEYLLATAIATLAPSPFPREDTASQTFVDEIIREASQRIQANPPFDDVAKGRVLSILSNELHRRMITPEGKRAARSRLGARGLLRNTDFRVSFTDMAQKQLTMLKLRSDEVRSVIQNPVAFDHLLPFNTAPTVGASLFVGSLQRISSAARILVLAERNEDRLKVWTTWPLDNDDFGPEMAHPQELLSAFANRFCVDFVIADKGPWRVLVREAVHIPQLAFLSVEQINSLMQPSPSFHTTFNGLIFARIGLIGVLEVFFALITDWDKYMEYCRSRRLI